MNTKTVTKAATPFLLLAVLVSAVAGAFVSRYVFTTPATVTVLVNDHLGVLYSDSDCTIPITTVNFGSLTKGDPENTGTLTSSVMYLKLPNLSSPETAYAKWTCSDLPGAMVLTGEYDNNFVGEWFPWASDVMTGQITEGENTIRLRFVVGAAMMAEGTHSFNIDIELGTN